jgi:lipopolysaccharide/colanic/teichoic acid biosynthesis glycosyltransferase
MLNRYGYRFVKRAFDIVASGCAIALMFAPSLVLCAVICIKSPGAGPIYGQTRVGRVKRDGSFSTFRLYKFRSMVPDADERLCALRDKNEADGPLFKIKEDPRLIPGVGKFIRKHSIDELPQLINVFCCINARNQTHFPAYNPICKHFRRTDGFAQKNRAVWLSPFHP